MIIDRRKLKISTDVSVGRFLERRKRVVAQKQYINLLGGRTDWEEFIPQFIFSRMWGVFNFIVPGNDQYVRGDVIKRDAWEEYMSRSRAAGGDGDEDDDFNYTPEELRFLDELFNGIQLPNLTKKSIESEEFEIVRCGYSTSGGIVDLKRTFRASIGRRAALEGGLKDTLTGTELEEERKKIPFLDDRDVRYRRYDKVVTPSKKMVMFLLLDVSGSMGKYEKNLAKLFSNLVVEFLSRKYDKCVIEYITFTDSAQRVSRQEFFYGKRSGGNMLYTALELQQDLMGKEYGEDWNVYNMIFSDTGMYADDEELSQELMLKLLPKLQYSIYANITEEYLPTLYSFTEPFIDDPAFTTVQLNEEEDIVNCFLRAFKS